MIIILQQSQHLHSGTKTLIEQMQQKKATTQWGNYNLVNDKLQLMWPKKQLDSLFIKQTNVASNLTMHQKQLIYVAKAT
jgi:hypothetical protein